jgi:hypothetical protein
MKVSVGLFCWALGAVASCAGDSSGGRASTLGLTSAEYRRTVSRSEAVEQLTNARCEREAMCKNVGSKQRYATLADCRRSVHRQLADALHADVCPHGVNRAKLANCVAIDRTERCGNLLDTIDRTMSCQRGALCTD